MITLTTPFTFAVNGQTIESDTLGACVSYSMNFLTRMLTVVFQIGVSGGSPANLVPGSIAQQQNQTVTVVVYLGPTANGLVYGNWWLGAGNLQASIIPSATLATFVTQLLGDRNSAETFVSVNGGLMPGVQTAWVAL